MKCMYLHARCEIAIRFVPAAFLGNHKELSRRTSRPIPGKQSCVGRHGPSRVNRVALDITTHPGETELRWTSRPIPGKQSCVGRHGPSRGNKSCVGLHGPSRGKHSIWLAGRQNLGDDVSSLNGRRNLKK